MSNETDLGFCSGMSFQACAEIAIEAAKVNAYEKGNPAARINVRFSSHVVSVGADSSAGSIQGDLDEQAKSLKEKWAREAADSRKEMSVLLGAAGVVTQGGDAKAIEWLARYESLVNNCQVTEKCFDQAYTALENAGYRISSWKDYAEAKGDKAAFGRWLIGVAMAGLKEQQPFHHNQLCLLLEEYEGMPPSGAPKTRPPGLSA